MTVSPTSSTSVSVSPSPSVTATPTATSCYAMPSFLNATNSVDLDNRPSACSPNTACWAPRLIGPVYPGMTCQDCWCVVAARLSATLGLRALFQAQISPPPPPPFPSYTTFACPCLRRDPAGTYPTWRILLTLPANSTPAICTVYPIGDGVHDVTSAYIYSSNSSGIADTLLGQQTTGSFAVPFTINLNLAPVAIRQYLYFLFKKTTTYQVRINLSCCVYFCISLRQASDFSNSQSLP